MCLCIELFCFPLPRDMFQDVEKTVNDEELKPADPNGFALSIYVHCLPILVSLRSGGWFECLET